MIIEANINQVDHLADEVLEWNMLVVASEVNLINNSKQWWVNTSATRYAYTKKKMFSNNKKTDGENL